MREGAGLPTQSMWGFRTKGLGAASVGGSYCEGTSGLGGSLHWPSRVLAAAGERGQQVQGSREESGRSVAQESICQLEPVGNPPYMTQGTLQMRFRLLAVKSGGGPGLFRAPSLIP